MRRRRSAAARPADRRPGRTASRAQRRGRRRPRRSAPTNGRDDVRRIIGIDDDGAAPAARNRHADAGVAATRGGGRRRLLALRRPRLVIGAWASDRDAVDLHGVIAVLRPQRGDDVGECAVAHAGDGAPAPDAVVRRARFTIILLHGSSFGRRAGWRGACATRRVRRVWTQDSVSQPPPVPPPPEPPRTRGRGGAGTAAAAPHGAARRCSVAPRRRCAIVRA